MTKIIEHPGVELGRRIQQTGLNLTRFAYSIDVSPSRISELVSGKRSFSVDSAIRVAKALETTPEYWLAKQVEFDLAQSEESKEAQRPSWMI